MLGMSQSQTCMPKPTALSGHRLGQQNLHKNNNNEHFSISLTARPLNKGDLAVCRSGTLLSWAHRRQLFRD